jgi:hypothetical protein
MELEYNPEEHQIVLTIDIASSQMTGKTLTKMLEGFRIASAYYQNLDSGLALDNDIDFQIESMQMNSPLKIILRGLTNSALFAAMAFGTGFFEKLGGNTADYFFNNQNTPEKVLKANQDALSGVVKSSINASISLCLWNCESKTVVYEKKVDHSQAVEIQEQTKKLLKIAEKEEHLTEVTLSLFSLANREEVSNKPSLDKGFISEVDAGNHYPITWIDTEGKNLIRKDKLNAFSKEFLVDVKVCRKNGSITRYKITHIYNLERPQQQTKLNLNT